MNSETGLPLVSGFVVPKLQVSMCWMYATCLTYHGWSSPQSCRIWACLCGVMAFLLPSKKSSGEPGMTSNMMKFIVITKNTRNSV